MSHPNSPTYFTISSVCQFDGSTTMLAVCEDMDAVMYRLKQCYTTCGDEYRINCYHLTTAEEACRKYNEQLVARRKYEREEREKELKLRAFDQLPDADKELAEELASHDVDDVGQKSDEELEKEVLAEDLINHGESSEH